MSERLPRDGVELVLEGSRTFIANLRKVDGAWQATVKGMEEGGRATLRATSGLDKLQTSTTKSRSGLLSMAGSLGSVVTGIGAFISIVGRASRALLQLGEGMAGLAIQASELQGVSAQFSILNQNVEGGANAMLRALQTASGGMVAARDLMTSFNDAAALVNLQFAQRLPEALNLLGKVSAATGEDLNFLLDSLVRGVGRVSPLILDNLKIQVGVAEATAKATEMFGKEADQLTKVEQQTALTELALAKLEEKFGALPDTTQTLAAQSSVLQANLQNLGDTVGQFLVPGMTNLVSAANTLITSLIDMISEGGALFPILVSLGAWFDILTNGVQNFAESIAQRFPKVVEIVTTSVGSLIENALRWGVELIAAFAQGIVEATTTVLTQAMQFIGNLLSSWLLGASPPKIAPGIVGWGISLMEQYLQGMTQADFGILKQIQGPLKKILEGPEFANISKALAGALAGGDRERFIETISRATGIFASSITKLAQAQFDLADATQAVEDAEQALARSREKVIDTQAEVNKETLEYNRLLRQGATRTELDAQLKLINAAESNLQTAMDQVNTQEQALKTAKDRQDQLTEEAKLQQDIVDQLLGINDALTEQEKAKEGAKGKGKGAAPTDITEALGIPTGLDIGGSIGKAIEDMKARIQEKLKDVFKPLGDAWQKIREDIGNLGQVWDQFVGVVGKAWDKLKEKHPILQDIEDWVKDLPTNLKKVRDWFRDKITAAVEAVTGVLWSNEDSLYNRWLSLWTFLKDDFWPWIRDTLWPKLVEFAETVVDPLAVGFATVGTSIGTVVTNLEKLIALAVLPVGVGLLPFLGESPSPLEIGLKGINRQLQVLATTRLPSIANMGTQMRGALAPTPMLAPVSNTAVTMNMGGNTFNTGTDEAAFDARVTQSLRRTLRRR